MNQFTVSLWGDESFAAVLASKPIFKIITIVARDTSPPLYYLSLHTWMKFFGTGEVSIRALSFSFFLLTCLFVFLIGQKLWDKKTGLLAATACFLNPFLFQYAFEGRMYAILLLTTTASTYFYLSKNRLGYILASTAALYSHHFSIFVIFTHFLWEVPNLFKKKAFFKTLKPYLAIGFLYLPWLYPLYYQTSLVGGGFWLGKPTLKSLGELINTFFLAPAKEMSRKFLILGYLGTFLLRRWGEFQKELLLVSVAVIPVFLTFAISQAFSSIFYDRYMLYVIPPILLLLVSRRRSASLLFIILTFIVLIPLNWRYFTHPTKRPFRDLANYVHDAKSLEYGLINYPGRAHHLFESKYYDLNAPLYVPGGDLPFFTGTALMEEEDIIKTLPEKEKIMLITSDEPKDITLPGYSFWQEERFGNLHLAWFEKE